MNEFFIYLMQSAFSLGALYLIYWFFLRKDTFFSANRFYLIGSIIISFVLPLFKVPVFYDNPELTYVVVLEAVTITAQKVESSLLNNLSIYQIIFIVYLSGAAIFFIRFIFQLLQLVFLIRKLGATNIDGLKVIKLNCKYSPFSYFNFIFLNEENLKDRNLKEIINHEKIHIKQKHSIDLILLEFLTIIQWFNPFIWFYKASIKGIHEYLADDGLLTNGLNKASYQKLLLNQSVGIQINNLTNNFNQSLIKKRFIMMTKNQSKKIARLKFLLAIPIAIVLIASFAFTLDKQALDQFPTVILNAADAAPNIENDQDVKAEKQEDKIFVVVENQPEYPGGEDARIAFLGSNIKYPAAARKAGIQGVVYVTYVVEKDGSIKDARIVRGIGGGCDEEAVRVINAMPNWIPGTQRGKAVRVQFNLPIRFTLDGKPLSKKEKGFSMKIMKVEDMPESEGGYAEVVSLLNEKQGDTKVVYVQVEDMPRIEGYESVSDFVKEKIKYPKLARKAGINGVVVITFMVEKDGSLTDIKIRKSLGNGCDEEALRVVNLMNFTPGKHKGKLVRVPYALPMAFKLK
ncbi:MAG: M56 family metallopeptidase [Bacteroidetes bacterium]|nr:M56 family metallopeptidase [Bacteroidota bacterium]